MENIDDLVEPVKKLVMDCDKREYKRWLSTSNQAL